jgi:hypothetical protein
MPTWIPLAIELIKGWAKEGEPKKGDIAKLFAAFPDIGSDDLDMIGQIMEVQGVAWQATAKIMKEAEMARQHKAKVADNAQ